MRQYAGLGGHRRHGQTNPKQQTNIYGSTISNMSTVMKEGIQDALQISWCQFFHTVVGIIFEISTAISKKPKGSLLRYLLLLGGNLPLQLTSKTVPLYISSSLFMYPYFSEV